MMRSFDPMAAAIDWLDAYRAADLSIVDLYSPTAVLECGCDAYTLISGKAALREYWRRRFSEKPAGALEHLKLSDEAIVVSYQIPSGVVETKLKYDDAGLIHRKHCCMVQSA